MPTPDLAIASAPAGSILPAILPSLLALLGLVVVGTIVVTVVRRRLRDPDSGAPEGFTLHELRELHARGALDDEEFERAKAAVIERARGATSENPGDSAT